MYLSRIFKSESWDGVMAQYNSFLSVNQDAKILDYMVSRHNKDFILTALLYIID